MADPRTVVFVHGAWGGAADWDLVIAELRDEPVDVVALDLPTSQRADASLADDVAHLRHTLAGLSGPVTLCAHSYGGAVITEGAPAEGSVDHLVYIAAFMPDVGDTVLGIGSTYPTENGLDLELRDDGTSMIKVWPREDGSYTDAAVEFMRARPRNWWAVAAAVTPIEQVAWRAIPSTYIIATRDAVSHPDAQRHMAAKATRVIELDSNHMAQAEFPADIATVVGGDPPR